MKSYTQKRKFYSCGNDAYKDRLDFIKLMILITLRNSYLSFFFEYRSFILFEHAPIANTIVINAAINTCLLIYCAKKKMKMIGACR